MVRITPDFPRSSLFLYFKSIVFSYSSSKIPQLHIAAFSNCVY